MTTSAQSSGVSIEQPERLQTLDVLRGIAAITVVFWHWPHFYFAGQRELPYTSSDLPLFEVFYLFYAKGELAVYLFFVLSGFVFYWQYRSSVANRTISAAAFFGLRFSRLYPLHVVTLLLVAGAQLWFLTSTGNYFVYPLNDARSFVLNLAFAQSWGLERGFSFNGPSWSVSVEVLLYIMFFVICRWLPFRSWIPLALVVCGFFVTRRLALVGTGIVFFFLGACTYRLYDLLQNQRSAAVSTTLLWLMIGAWIGTAVYVKWQLDASSVSISSFRALSHTYLSLDLSRQSLAAYWPLVLFPLTILALALLERTRGHVASRIKFLGDISYSSYLLHFPLQMLTMMLIIQFQVDHRLFGTTWFLICFATVLVLISLASYHWFERPLQRYLRARMGVRSRASDG